jgi:hypothetical protein
MNSQFWMTVVIVVGLTALYAGVLALVLEVDVRSVPALTLPGK